MVRNQSLFHKTLACGVFRLLNRTWIMNLGQKPHLFVPDVNLLLGTSFYPILTLVGSKFQELSEVSETKLPWAKCPPNVHIWTICDFLK